LNIVIYKGQFQYDVVNYFVKELELAFNEMGHAVITIDLLTTNPNDIISFFLKNRVDLILSFNGINFVDKSIYEKLNIPLGIILVDHPFYHISRIKAYKGKTTFICMYDLEYLDCFEECIDNDIPISWLLHGGTEVQSESYVEKEYDIIIPASIGNYNYFEQKLLELQEGIVKEIALNLYERGKTDYNHTLYTYFKEELNSMGISMQDLMNNEDYLTAFSYIYILVDKALRTRNRYRTVKKLLDEEFTIYHYGNLQNDELTKYSNFISNGPLDYINLIKEIKKSKLLLNDEPYFQNGSHERLFTSMLNKTLVLSNINNYCNNQYKDGESIVFYDMNNLDTLVDKIHYYLENEDDRKCIEEKAYKITKRFNTWRNRAEEIINIYSNFIELKNSSLPTGIGEK